MFDIIFLKFVIVIGAAVNCAIASVGIAYNYYLEKKNDGSIQLTVGDLGAIRAAIDDKLSTVEPEIIEVGVSRGDDLTQI